MNIQTTELLQDVPTVINIGVRDFAESLLAQGIQVVQVEWSPPAEGDQEMLALLDALL